MPQRKTVKSLYHTAANNLLKFTTHIAVDRSNNCPHSVLESNWCRTPFCTKCWDMKFEQPAINLPIRLARDLVEKSRAILHSGLFPRVHGFSTTKMDFLTYVHAYNVFLFLHDDDKELRHDLRSNKGDERCAKMDTLTLNIMSKRCKSIETFTLTAGKLFSEHLLALQCLIKKHGAGIRVLRVLCSDSELGDETMETIAEYAPNLQKLSLAGHPFVTDKGAGYLCGIGTKAVCSNLETLELIGTGVTEEGIQTVLLKSKKLKIIRERYSDCLTTGAFCSLVKKHDDVCINLIDLDLCFGNETTAVLLPDILKLTPHLKRLELQITGDAHEKVDFNAICVLKDLQHLALHWNGNGNGKYESISDMLTEIGPKLIELQLRYCVKMDVSAIIASCPDIEALYLGTDAADKAEDASNSLVCKYLNSCDNTKMQKLRSFTLQGSYSHPQCITQECLIHILQHSTHLEKLDLYHVDALCKETVQAAIAVNRLPCLKEIITRDCCNFNADALFLFMGLQNPLSRVYVENCDMDNSDRDRVNDHTKKHNLETETNATYCM